MAYEFNGEEYEKASAHQKQWGARLIEELDLAGDERILDLGCGDGVLTARLAQRVPQGRVLGIDASRGMIDTARRHTAGNLDFAVQDINALDYENEFDLAFSNATLHWIKDHRSMLHRVYRALRQGGAIRFSFAADGNCSGLLTVIKRAMAMPAHRADFDHFDWPWFMPTLEEYRALVSQSGFRDIRIWLENADHFFPDAEAMIRWVDQPSLVPFLAHLAEPRRRAFRNLVVEQMVRQTARADGRCFETFRRINVFARKHG